MSEAKHTPGPWEWANDEVFSEPSNTSICVVLQRDNCAANASLIAAAPDLLEALKKYERDYCEGFCKGSHVIFEDEDCGGCAARAAIAKATGA